MKKHNFSAGPSMLPPTVFEQAAQSVLDYNGSGLSILEISHRSDAFIEILDQAQKMVLQILNLENKGYQVLFLQGGASMEFLRIPYNFMHNYKKAAYLDTGVWAHKAIEEAKAFGEVQVIASSKDKQYDSIPKWYIIPENVDYFHCTSNNTIYGTQMKVFPETNVPVICDMSSDLFSRSLMFDKFDVIYAGAQKNLGPAGVSVVVIKTSFLEGIKHFIPNILNYQKHIENNSMYNTPAVFAIYTSYLTLRWILKQGGISALEQRNNEKAALLYEEIDRNSLFKGIATVEDRSLMNVTFTLVDETLTVPFDSFWPAYQINGLKGHRTLGGYRASIYNAMPISSVKVLIQCLQDFEKKYKNSAI